ncbi:MAG: hypothetical protein GF334_03745 [Candidatus Altiarchaeales archaeon]|nr:hypothetical protein [Candidatus Altiarchaeales archaeon]
MAPQAHPTSWKCRSCESSKVEQSPDYGEFYLICHDCGILFMPQDEEDEGTEITASVVSCPHCASVDSIFLYGDQETCSVCGLDPDEENIPASEMAHLWKDRGPEVGDKERTIRETMLAGQTKFDAETRIGYFLRNFCGPHCSLANSCPQTTRNFARCFREEMGTSNETMGKGKKRRKSRKKKQGKEKAHSAWLLVAGGGWYNRNKQYGTKTYSEEQVTG